MKRFGLITTNSISQTFQRRIVQAHLSAKPPLSLVFAIPDHPWVDTADGAAVRIAMTVGVAGEHSGELFEVTAEEPQKDGSAKVVFKTTTGQINADLTIGANVTQARPLGANDGICSPGVQLYGDGFIVSAAEAKELRESPTSPDARKVIRSYVNGRDFMQDSRGCFVIDFFGLDEEAARKLHPAAFQRVLTHVKPERDQNRREPIRKTWWRFGWERPGLRQSIAAIPRFIATPETAKHRVFTFLDCDVLPDNRLTNIALEDAYFLGVLSSRIHVVWALAAGATLEDRPVYTKSTCYDCFPFPACDAAAQQRIRQIAEELDAHRKRVQAQHPGLTLTGMYNVLQRLRAISATAACDQEPQSHDGRSMAEPQPNGAERLECAELAPALEPPPPSPQRQQAGRTPNASRGPAPLPSTASLPLSEKEKQIHDAGLVSVLRQLHDELDAAVFAAYGWPATLTDAEILQRVVALNAERAKEEAAGLIRWLRPDYQNPKGNQAQQAALAIPALHPPPSALNPRRKLPWPKTMAERVQAVNVALAAVKQPVTAAEMAKGFARVKAPDVSEILETLCTMGHARRGKAEGTFLP